MRWDCEFTCVDRNCSGTYLCRRALGKSTHAEVTQLNIQLNEKLDGLTDLLLKLQQENGQNTGRVTVEDVARYDIPDGELTFLLSVEGDATHNVNTLCPKASFSEGLLNGRESHGHTSNESIFTCRCASNGSGKEARHQRRLSFFCMIRRLLQLDMC